MIEEVLKRWSRTLGKVTVAKTMNEMEFHLSTDKRKDRKEA